MTFFYTSVYLPDIKRDKLYDNLYLKTWCDSRPLRNLIYIDFVGHLFFMAKWSLYSYGSVMEAGRAGKGNIFSYFVSLLHCHIYHYAFFYFQIISFTMSLGSKQGFYKQIK